MKLEKFPEYLPIETVNEVTSILANLIGLLTEREVFDLSESIADYKETIDHLNRDLEDCINLYESWKIDDKAHKYQDELKRMHTYLEKADALLKAMPSCVH